MNMRCRCKNALAVLLLLMTLPVFAVDNISIAGHPVFAMEKVSIAVTATEVGVCINNGTQPEIKTAGIETYRKNDTEWTFKCPEAAAQSGGIELWVTPPATLDIKGEPDELTLNIVSSESRICPFKYTVTETGRQLLLNEFALHDNISLLCNSLGEVYQRTGSNYRLSTACNQVMGLLVSDNALLLTHENSDHVEAHSPCYFIPKLNFANPLERLFTYLHVNQKKAVWPDSKEIYNFGFAYLAGRGFIYSGNQQKPHLCVYCNKESSGSTVVFPHDNACDFTSRLKQEEADFADYFRQIYKPAVVVQDLQIATELNPTAVMIRALQRRSLALSPLMTIDMSEVNGKPFDPNNIKYKRIFYLPLPAKKEGWLTYFSDDMKELLSELDLSFESDRLKTYRHWGIGLEGERPSPIILAQEGLVYTGNIDRTKCYWCSSVFRGYRCKHFDARQFHYTQCPSCPMATRLEKNNVCLYSNDRKNAKAVWETFMEEKQRGEINPYDNSWTQYIDSLGGKRKNKGQPL